MITNHQGNPAGVLAGTLFERFLCSMANADGTMPACGHIASGDERFISADEAEPVMKCWRCWPGRLQPAASACPLCGRRERPSQLVGFEIFTRTTPRATIAGHACWACYGVIVSGAA